MSIILRVDGLLGKMNGTVYGEQVSPNKVTAKEADRKKRIHPSAIM
jgi:hypothetical protein